MARQNILNMNTTSMALFHLSYFCLIGTDYCHCIEFPVHARKWWIAGHPGINPSSASLYYDAIEGLCQTW